MTPPDYVPDSSPFMMPLCVLRVHAELTQPLALPVHPGATLNTTLRGALGHALVQRGLGWLHEPRSLVQKRDHASPIVVRARWVDATSGLRQLELRLLLLGRTAQAQRETILSALEDAAHRGIGPQCTAFHYRLEPEFNGTLAEWVVRRIAPPVHDLRIELLSPMQADVREFANIVADAAHELVQWDLVDAQLAAMLGKPGCDRLAEEARSCAQRCFAGVDIALAVDQVRLGRRRSRSNGHRFWLDGYVGSVALRGDLAAALPWLSVLELRGGGRKKSFGLGEVRLQHGESHAPGVVEVGHG